MCMEHMQGLRQGRKATFEAYSSVFLSFCLSHDLLWGSQTPEVAFKHHGHLQMVSCCRKIKFPVEKGY